MLVRSVYLLVGGRDWVCGTHPATLEREPPQAETWAGVCEVGDEEGILGRH